MNKFHAAMAFYAVLAAAGAAAISDSRVRICLWIFLGGLAAKTAIEQYRPKD